MDFMNITGIFASLFDIKFSFLLIFTYDDDDFGISFDEALNDVSLNNQMDITVKCFDTKRVKTLPTTTNHLFTDYSLRLPCPKLDMKDLNMKKMVHISMGGRNVNGKFLELLKKDLWGNE